MTINIDANHLISMIKEAYIKGIKHDPNNPNQHGTAEDTAVHLVLDYLRSPNTHHTV